MTTSEVSVTYMGQTYPMTLGSDGYWSVSVQAPMETSGSNTAGVGPGVGSAAEGKGYYAVTITATDEYGNSTTIDVTDSQFGEALKLKVKETAKPVASITSPGDSAHLTTAKPTITFTITDTGSGVNPNAIFIQIDSSAAVALTSAQVSMNADGSVATCTYIPTSALAEGNHTIKVYGSDYDGNVSDTVQVTFSVDTVKPTLSLTTPTEGQKFNVADITVTGTTNDATSSPVTVTVKVNNTSYTPAVSGGAFSQAVKLSNGANTITVTATDASGLETTITRTVYYSTAAPTFIEVTATPNPSTVGATIAIKVKVTDED